MVRRSVGRRTQVERLTAIENGRIANIMAKIDGSAPPVVKARNKWKKKTNRTGWAKSSTKVKKKRFDAFAVNSSIIMPTGKKVISTKAVEPETGIHSRLWAAQILPQSGFLSLPIEVRHKIYEAAFIDEPILNPRTKESKFTLNKSDSATIHTYSALAQVCRQTYVEVVGGGLLYAFAHFHFSSPQTMLNYVSAINPAHKEALRKISLSISIIKSSPLIHDFVFTTLASLPNLCELEVNLVFSFDVCSEKFEHQRIDETDPYEVRSVVVSKLEEQKDQWQLLKGLSSFVMTFGGDFKKKNVPFPVRPANYYYLYSDRQRHVWAEDFFYFYADDPRLEEIEFMVRSIVTRTGAE